MNINNVLTQQNTDTQQLRFVPISSNVSYLGTSVTYGLGTNSIISASNTSNLTSGAGYNNSVGYNNTIGGNSINAGYNFTNTSVPSGNWVINSNGNWSSSPSASFTNTTNLTPFTTGVNSSIAGLNTTGTNINSAVTGITPYVSASQFGQLGSGVVNTTNFNTQIRTGVTVQPAIDISETSSDIVVSAYVSNAVVNDINLNVTQDSITLSGSLVSGNNLYVLNRTVPLSTSVRAEAVEATLQSGVLEVRLPKTEKFNRSKTTVAGSVIQG